MDMNLSEMVDGWLNVPRGNGKEPATRQEGDRARDDQGATGVSGQATRLGAHTCTTNRPEQSRIPHQGISARTSDNSRQHLPRSSVQQSPPRIQMRQGSEAPQLTSSSDNQLTAKPHFSGLDESCWICFYDLYTKNTLTFTNRFPESDVKNALIQLLIEGRVSLDTVKSISDNMASPEDQKKAFNEVTTQYLLLKHSNPSKKATTSTDRSASSRTTTSNQAPVVGPNVRIKAPVNTGALSSNDLSAQRHAQGTRAKVSEPVDSSRSVRPQQPLNTAVRSDATLARNLPRTPAFTSTFTLTADAKKTKSTGCSPVSGAAGSFLQENQLLPETYSSRYVLESVIPAHGNPETMRKPHQQATQHITTDSSNSRLPPPPVRKQEASLISPDSLFTPLSPAPDIRPEFPINTHADTAVNPTLAANTRQHFPVPRQKALEFAGTRPKHPQYTSSPFAASARQRDAMERDQAQDIQRLSILFADIDISESTIHELVKRNCQNKNAYELYNTLHYELELSSETSSQVVESIKPQRLEAWRDYRQKYDKERINRVAPGQSAEELQKQIEREAMFSARKISDPQVEILAVGSHMSDGSGSTFDVRRTAFADFGENTDLRGDIHDTVDDIPEGKKFKEIHFTHLPGYVFDKKDASITLLKKINKVMHKDGVLILSFGTGGKFNYDYKFLFENVLKPAGFADCIDIATSDFFGVQMLVFKNKSRNTRPLPPQPAWISGVAWPVPVIPARKEAVPARSTGTLSQPVTQTIREPDSVHLGNATEEQISRIIRNLKLFDPNIDEATCSGIKESINSMDLDNTTIEQAAGGIWREETRNALDRIQMQYIIQKSSHLVRIDTGIDAVNTPEVSTLRQEMEPAVYLVPANPSSQHSVRNSGFQAGQPMTGPSTKISPQVPFQRPAESLTPPNSNAATKEQVKQIVKHLRGMINPFSNERAVPEALVTDIEQNFRQIPLSATLIKDAACGDNAPLSEVLIAYQTVETGSPQLPSLDTQQHSVSPTGFGGLVQAEGFIDGTAVGASELSQIELSTEVAPKGQPAAPLRGNRVIENRPLTAVFKDEIKLNYLIQHLKGYFKRNAQGILISRESLNRFLERHVGSISEKDFRAASAGAEDCVKDIARAYEKWQGNENTGSNRPVGLPALAPNPQAGLIPNDAGSVRGGYAPWNVGSFMMTPNIQTDGATAWLPGLSPERSRAQTNPQAEHHEHAFRSGLNALLAAQDDELPFDFGPASLMDAMMAIREQDQANKQEIQRLANTGSYPVRGYTQGAVSVQQAAGIQAARNNCAIASVLMGMSHRGSLRLLIEQIQQAVERAQALRATLRIDTVDNKANRDNRKLLEALDRLQVLDRVLVKYDSLRLESIRVNDDLDEIRRSFTLAEGVNLEPDEFFEQMIMDLRSLQSLTGCSRKIEIFNFPVDKRAELAGMTMSEAFTRFYLEELAHNKDSRLEDSDVIVLSPPTFGANERVGMVLSDTIEKFDSKGNLIEYRLAGSVNISEAHYVSFLRDDEKGLLYLANSMGMRMGSDDSQPFMVPTVITMPINGTEDALDNAIINTTNEADGALMHQTKDHWKNLDRNCRLAIYTRGDNR